MNPEKVTTSQFFGSFTAKHWVAAIAFPWSVISLTAYGGYWAGQKLAEAQSLAQQAELKGTIAQLQAKLEVVQSSNAALVKENVGWRDDQQKLQNLLAQRNAEVAKLSAQLGRTNNCTFIHEQIRAVTAEIDRRGNRFVFDASGDWHARQKENNALLEKRLEGYKQQLGACNQ